MIVRHSFSVGFSLFLLASLGTTASMSAWAQQIDPRREYASCMAEARSNPKDGFDHATHWLGLGGGDAARHCQGAALIGMGQHEEGARRIEALAQDMRAESVFRAELLAQAAQGWMLAGKPDKAEATLNAAIKLAPEDVELYIDRAQALAQRGDLEGAVADLNLVLKRDPLKSDAYVFRASAYRQLGKTDLASADLVTALQINPLHVEAFLERGMLNRLAGNTAAARRDWLTVIERAPNSPAAATASQNLGQMDGNAGQTKGKAKGK
jgi:tetratricopeptide (TPR) repeat protein